MSKIVLLNKEYVKSNYFRLWGEMSAQCYDQPEEKYEMIGKKCLKDEHFSGCRDIYFRFCIKEISRTLSLQLNRHEVGVVKNQRSQRYCFEGDGGYVTPDIILNNDSLRKQYEEQMQTCLQTYRVLYDKILEQTGNKEVAKENARFILPQSMFTQGVYSFTLEALINLAHKRLCSRAQDEIRLLTNDMVNEIVSVLPELKTYLVPKCVYLGKCKESKCCGFMKKETKNV